MKILDKYIFFSFISIFLFCTVFLYVLFVIGDIFGFLDEILRAGIGINALGAFYFYMMPFVITQIAPISCLLSSAFLLGNLNRHNEITALKASGVSLFKIIRPMLISACVIGVFIFILNDKVVPGSMRMANKIRYEKLEVGKRGKSQPIVMRNVAIYGQGNRIMFAKKFNVTANILEDVIIHTHDKSQNVISKLSLKTMLWEGGTWIGKQVVIYNIDTEGQFIGNPKIYEEKEISIKETPVDFINNQWQPQFMGYMQLKKYLEVFLAGSKLASRRFTVDLYYKLSFPFSCLVMILIAAPFTIVTSRGKALLGMARGILIALTYIPIVAIGMALGKGGVLPPILAAWSANIILGLTGLYLTLKH
jgi:lipopolysaccharide export system permease protein